MKHDHLFDALRFDLASPPAHFGNMPVADRAVHEPPELQMDETVRVRELERLTGDGFQSPHLDHSGARNHFGPRGRNEFVGRLCKCAWAVSSVYVCERYNCRMSARTTADRWWRAGGGLNIERPASEFDCSE